MLFPWLTSPNYFLHSKNQAQYLAQHANFLKIQFLPASPTTSASPHKAPHSVYSKSTYSSPSPSMFFHVSALCLEYPFLHYLFTQSYLIHQNLAEWPITCEIYHHHSLGSYLIHTSTRELKLTALPQGIRPYVLQRVVSGFITYLYRRHSTPVWGMS